MTQLEATHGVRGCVRKRRNLWILDATRIHLDEVEGLGTFVELETVSEEAPGADEQHEHDRVWTALGLDARDTVAGSYIDLLEPRHCVGGKCRFRNRVSPLSELVADPGAWAGLRQPRLPPRRHRSHPPALQREALDRLPARVPGLAAGPVAPAGPLHRALLPRRGDRFRRGPSPLRSLPLGGLRRIRQALERAPSRSGRRGRDRHAAPFRARRARHAQTAPPPSAARRAPGWLVRAPRRRPLARPRVAARALDGSGLCRSEPAPERRGRRADHPAVTRRDPRYRLARGRAAAPPVRPHPGSHLLRPPAPPSGMRGRPRGPCRARSCTGSRRTRRDTRPRTRRRSPPRGGCRRGRPPSRPERAGRTRCRSAP